jgi:hypothetical protein
LAFTKIIRFFAIQINDMIQRVQTLYLLIFLGLSVALISGVNILEFSAKGSDINQNISLCLNTSNISLSGELNLPEAELDLIAKKMSKTTPIRIDKNTQTLSYKRFTPLLFIQGSLVLLAIIVMFSYKNLKSQLNLARFLFFLTLLYVALHMFLAYFALNYARPFIEELPIDDIEVARITHIGFYLICALLPFAYLAQLGIKRDYSLIKSLDRLR